MTITIDWISFLLGAGCALIGILAFLGLSFFFGD
jgi:hypothetical protein